MRLATTLSRKVVPLSWGRRIAARRTIKEIGFIGVWQFQARLSATILLSLAAFIGAWQAVIVMLPWGLTATHWYETARANGLQDILETPAPTKNKGQRLGSWLFYGLKIYLFDFKQFVFFHLLGPSISRRSKSSLRMQGRRLLIILGMTLFGVLATHHALSLAGYSRRQIYWGNMAARVLNIPVKILETTILVGLLFLIVRLITGLV
ncbi:MAG: hypothetical protein A2172_04195 [Candidatus Woykebacteria bacterium RBG_13_40_15]|uniref:Uncharacterized protein n=1 Tax=Candidatus Woykebacteria bacterium RBG_13_40_15 TaxID=1802593 RepID=A0A1G1W6Z1_9BACT|nr:MAG: hypothetical protein A2172_04195 [Candidatus Woykebacteria bacterium RBG_13_40_15]